MAYAPWSKEPPKFKSLAPILLGVALSLVIDVAAAEVPSDNELYAAYCIGVLQQEQQARRKESEEFEQTLDDDKQKEELRRGTQKDQSDLDRKISRFRSYLAVRGFLPTGGRDRLAYTGIQVALQRGRADVQ
jgi:hypothetical protein